MAFKSFVEDARKTNKLMESKKDSATADSIIDTTDPNYKLPEQKTISNNNNNNNNFKRNDFNYSKQEFNKPQIEKKDLPSFVEKYSRAVPSTNFKKQSVDSRHCNLIADVIKKSGTNFSGDANWNDCKYLKSTNGNHYCMEFQSLCGKEKCKRATK